MASRNISLMFVYLGVLCEHIILHELYKSITIYWSLGNVHKYEVWCSSPLKKKDGLVTCHFLKKSRFIKESGSTFMRKQMCETQSKLYNAYFMCVYVRARVRTPKKKKQ